MPLNERPPPSLSSFKQRRRKALRPLREQNPTLYRTVISAEGSRVARDVYIPPGTAISPREIRSALSRTDPYLLQTFATFVFGTAKTTKEDDKDGKHAEMVEHGTIHKDNLEAEIVTPPQPAALKPVKERVEEDAQPSSDIAPDLAASISLIVPDATTVRDPDSA
ncbi:hypothetical protein HDU93_003057, partial [Gonapodya sp. JEL0774]